MAWKNAVLSVVIRVYNFRVSNAEDELSSVAAVIDTEEALKKRGETECMPATDKASFAMKAKDALSRQKRKKATDPEVASWLGKRKMG